MTPGHGFEWARLAFGLGFEARGPAAVRRRACTKAGTASGFVYTVDWDGRPVVRDHLSWVLCEAIAAAAVLGERELERQWWELAERVFIDREGGGWWMACDAENRPSSESGTASPTSTTRCGALNAASLRDALGASHAGLRLLASIGGGVIAAAVITSANAASRTSSAAAPRAAARRTRSGRRRS